MNRGKPEKIALPEKPPPRHGVSPVEPPFSIKIGQIRYAGQQNVEEQLRNLRHERIKRLQELRKSKLIVYYAWDMLDSTDAEQFYEILSTFGKTDNIDLFILSPGGFSSPAFKIARLCQEYSTERFSVLIPNYAKSAATIVALAADEIVMGPTSELGPIDPQIKIDTPEGPKVTPLLALRDALKFIKGEVAENPANALLYMPLLEKVELMSLGHYDREIESSRQYAESLLTQRMFKDEPEKAKEIAKKLLEEYKTHGYVIDRKEAREKLQLEIVDAQADQWEAMWQLHNLYDNHLRELRIQPNVAAKVMETLEIYMRPLRAIQPPGTGGITVFKTERGITGE